LPDNENPVKKVLLVSMALNDPVNIDDAAADGGNNDGGAQNNNQMIAMLGQNNALLRHDLAETRTELRNLWTGLFQTQVAHSVTFMVWSLRERRTGRKSLQHVTSQKLI
jgi:hypothetical protein